MHTFVRWPLIVLSAPALAMLISCGHSKDGPAPLPAAEPLAPNAVCVEQLTTTLTVRGTGLSPLPIDVVAGSTKLALPTVALLRTQDLDGVVTTDAPLLIPDTPTDPAVSHVRWISQEELRFDINEALKTPPGLYTVRVTNANGKFGEWTDSLLAVPRPSVLAAKPDLLCAAKDGEFVLTGGMFIKQGDTLPKLRATAAGAEAIELTPSSANKCKALPGAGGYEACEELVIKLGAGTLPSGAVSTTYALSIENPTPVGCSSTESVSLTMVPAPKLDSISPEVVCTAGGDNTLTLVGSGFLTIDGVAPVVALGKTTVTSTASDCVSVDGPSATVQSCKKLVLQLQKDGLGSGTHDVVVTNPAPADCATSEPIKLAVVPPPTVTAIKPDLVCNAQGDVTLTIEGKDFLSITTTGTPTLVPDVRIGGQTFTPVPSKCTTLPGLVSTVELCTELQVTVPQGSLSSGTHDVVVQNPAPADCQSEQSIKLTIVPPPSITQVSPDIVCPNVMGAPLTITGQGFLRSGTVEPTVKLGTATLSAVASDCTPLIGPAATTEVCTTLTVTVPALAPAGLQKLSVSNPASVGCTSTEVDVYVAPPPVVTSLAPPDVCSALPSSTLVATGTGFLVISGQAPAVDIGGKAFTATAGDCTSVAGLKESLEVCKTLTLTVLQNDLSAGQQNFTVTNPAPAGCASPLVTLDVVPPPVLTSVLPTKVCVGGGDILLGGTGFRPGATVTVDGQPATSVTVNSATSITANFAASALQAGGPYAVTVSNPDSCSSTKAATLTVVPGPQLFFVDPPVAYNGITNQLTIYGSGFTGAIKTLAIRPTGTTQAPLALTFSIDPLKPNQVQATLPKATAAGSYDLILQDQTTCDAELKNSLKIVDQVTLNLTAVSPPFGYQQSATGITVFADATVAGGFVPLPRLYLNATTGTQATVLSSTAFVDSSRVTAVVPKGLAVDAYDVIAVNPDGAVGLLPAAFRVTALAPPVLTSITPGSVANLASVALKVVGMDFRAPTALLRCLDVGSNVEVQNTPVVNTFTATEINLVVDASSFSNGAVCVVRIVNDDATYGELASLVITNPAQNLSAFADGPTLTVPRRALVATAGAATSAARFVYAIGGDSGTDAQVLDSVEVAPVDIFGKPGSFFTQRNPLLTARSFAGVATLGRCFYVVGGQNGAQVLDTVERACVLDPAERSAVVDVDLVTSTTAGLEGGLWYYQVAALLPASHAQNPSGETLPSDPFPLLLPTLANRKLELTIHWSAVPGAVGYRVYRSPTAGAAADALELLTEINSGSTTQYKDSGVTTQAGRPQRLGETGRWHTLAAKLSTPRRGAGVATVSDPATPGLHHLFVVGGFDGTQALASHERLEITVAANGTQTAGASFAGQSGTLSVARRQLQLLSVSNAEASFVSPPDTFLYVLGGAASNGTTMEGNVDAFLVQGGGALGTRIPVDAMQPTRAGYAGAAAANFLFAFGGNKAKPSTSVTSIKICAGSGPQCTAGPPELENWNNASAQMRVPRYLCGSTLQSGFIYLFAGQTDTSSASTSTEYTIY